MEDFLASSLIFMGEMYTAFIDSTFFFVFKILAAIYTAVLTVDLILLMYLGDMKKKYRELRRGSGVVAANDRKSQKMWKGIYERLESHDEDQWKLAVLEADHLLDKNLAEQGYHGDNFAERLAQLPAYTFSSLDDVREAHALRNRIVRDDDFEVELDQATSAVRVMEQFLEDLGIGVV